MSGWARFFPTFSVAFILCYAACVFFNLAAFTYMPALHQAFPLVPALAHARGAYPMFWYGWLVTTTVAALVITAATSFLPARNDRVIGVLTWVAPLIAVVVVVYALRIWFTL
jgi:hypothetical protein